MQIKLLKDIEAQAHHHPVMRALILKFLSELGLNFLSSEVGVHTLFLSRVRESESQHCRYLGPSGLCRRYSAAAVDNS